MDSDTNIVPDRQFSRGIAMQGRRHAEDPGKSTKNRGTSQKRHAGDGRRSEKSHEVDDEKTQDRPKNELNFIVVSRAKTPGHYKALVFLGGNQTEWKYGNSGFLKTEVINNCTGWLRRRGILDLPKIVEM